MSNEGNTNETYTVRTGTTTHRGVKPHQVITEANFRRKRGKNYFKTFQKACEFLRSQNVSVNIELKQCKDKT